MLEQSIGIASVSRILPNSLKTAELFGIRTNHLNDSEWFIRTNRLIAISRSNHLNKRLLEQSSFYLEILECKSNLPDLDQFVCGMCGMEMDRLEMDTTQWIVFRLRSSAEINRVIRTRQIASRVIMGLYKIPKSGRSSTRTLPGQCLAMIQRLIAHRFGLKNSNCKSVSVARAKPQNRCATDVQPMGVWTNSLLAYCSRRLAVWGTFAEHALFNKQPVYRQCCRLAASKCIQTTAILCLSWRHSKINPKLPS